MSASWTSMSSVDNATIHNILSSMELILIDGNTLPEFELVAPENGYPEVAPFPMQSYKDEAEATPPYLDYLQIALEKLGVPFGRRGSPEGFWFRDVQAYKNMLRLQTPLGEFRGSLGAVAVPFGVLSYNLAMRLALQLKQTADRDAFKMEDQLMYESVLQLLAAYSTTEYPPELVVTNFLIFFSQWSPMATPITSCVSAVRKSSFGETSHQGRLFTIWQPY